MAREPFARREAIVVMAKAPREGAVKTRLHASMGSARATALYECFLRDTFEYASRAATVRASAWLVLCYAPAHESAAFEGIVDETVLRLPQRGEDLGARLEAAVRDLAKLGAERIVIVGADSPTLPPERVAVALETLESGTDVVLGPTDDGGYYLVGVGGVHDAIFREIDWSTSRVLEQTLARAAPAGLSVELLEPWFDVDEPADLERLRGACDGAAHTKAFLAADGRR